MGLMGLHCYSVSLAMGLVGADPVAMNAVSDRISRDCTSQKRSTRMLFIMKGQYKGKSHVTSERAIQLGSAALVAAFAIIPGTTVAQEAGGAAAGPLEEIVVVGSRRRDRSASDSPVPVDVIGGDDFLAHGDSDLDSVLAALVPSYNVAQEPISDAATLIRPATLRSLPPDATLVLVNGKRRHRAAVIALLGAGISGGSQGPDLSVIPVIALDRLEVLRDGASAQYGSDAIAGS